MTPKQVLPQFYRGNTGPKNYVSINSGYSNVAHTMADTVDLVKKMKIK